jgi:hypothetical protein
VSFTGSAPAVKLVRTGDSVSVYVTTSGAKADTRVLMVSISFYR